MAVLPSRREDHSKFSPEGLRAYHLHRIVRWRTLVRHTCPSRGLVKQVQISKVLFRQYCSRSSYVSKLSRKPFRS